jgi:hypothetical protein
MASKVTEIQINSYIKVELGISERGNVKMVLSNTFYGKYFDAYFAPCMAREIAAALLAYANHVERG